MRAYNREGWDGGVGGVLGIWQVIKYKGKKTVELMSTKKKKWSKFLTTCEHKMRLNVKTFWKAKSVIQMQDGLCCYMNYKEYCSEVTPITGINPVASFPATIVASLFQGGPAGDLEQIDSYLEALLKEDNLLFQNTLNKGTTDTGQSLPLEKNESTSQNWKSEKTFPF